MNGLEITREEAAKAGAVLDDDSLGYIMWNETGWPEFFDGDPETCFREQLRKVLVPLGKRQERAALQATLPTRWERLKEG